MAGERERVDAYLDTIRRMEPEIAMVDRDAALAFLAISAKRFADELTRFNAAAATLLAVVVGARAFGIEAIKIAAERNEDGGFFDHLRAILLDEDERLGIESVPACSTCAGVWSKVGVCPECGNDGIPF